MVTKESLVEYINYNKSIGYKDPIFSIMMFEYPDKEKIYPTGKHSGFPDLGSAGYMGFYYDLDDAIAAMNENACDIREYTFNAGFILCHYPGLYQSAGKESRMYFVWDKDKAGFFQQEEPEIFKHVSY